MNVDLACLYSENPLLSQRCRPLHRGAYSIDTVSGGTRACTKVTKDNFKDFTFECYRGDRINSDCNRGTISTNAYGLCVVPATPVDSTWAAGKDFARSSDNVGPGYCVGLALSYIHNV